MSDTTTDKEDVQREIRQMYDNGTPVSELSDLFNTTRPKIRTALRKVGRLPKSPAITL